MIEEYRDRGFTSIERITSDDELAWLREVYDALFAARLAGVQGGYFDLARPYDADGADLLPQALFPERAVPDLLATAYFRNARRIAAALLERDPAELEVWGHMITKPAHIGHQTPWHQDEAYWDPGQRFHAVGAWMPLDDCDESNGCMTFVPGSHRSAVLPHRHINGDPNVHGLEFAAAVAGRRRAAARRRGLVPPSAHPPPHGTEPERASPPGLRERVPDDTVEGGRAGTPTVDRRDARGDVAAASRLSRHPDHVDAGRLRKLSICLRRPAGW